jgi:hypothetical protein
MSSHSSENGNRSSFRNAVFFSFQNTGQWTESENPVILSVIHHHQYPHDVETPVRGFCYPQILKGRTVLMRAVVDSGNLQIM